MNSLCSLATNLVESEHGQCKSLWIDHINHLRHTYYNIRSFFSLPSRTWPPCVGTAQHQLPPPEIKRVARNRSCDYARNSFEYIIHMWSRSALLPVPGSGFCLPYLENDFTSITKDRTTAAAQEEQIPIGWWLDIFHVLIKWCIRAPRNMPPPPGTSQPSLHRFATHP